MTGSLGGIKPGNRVGGKEDYKERRRWRNPGEAERVPKPAGGRGRRAARFLVGVSPDAESCHQRPGECHTPDRHVGGVHRGPAVSHRCNQPATGGLLHPAPPSPRQPLPGTTLQRGSRPGDSEGKCEVVSVRTGLLSGTPKQTGSTAHKTRARQAGCRKEGMGWARPCAQGLG